MTDLHKIIDYNCEVTVAYLRRLEKLIDTKEPIDTYIEEYRKFAQFVKDNDDVANIFGL